ncbi:MAG: hypothetical protein ABIW94_06845 [Gemmatimonadaceae bacterium]
MTILIKAPGVRFTTLIAAAGLALAGCATAAPPATTTTATTAPTTAPSAAAVSPRAMDPDKLVADGGVKMAGWTGRIDPQAAKAGRNISEAKFVGMGTGFHVTSGPAAVYWNPANTAKGNYTVTSRFTQTKAAVHPEGYGVIISGQNLDAANQSYLYFMVRQDGKYLINHRANDSTVHKMVDWTANPAVKTIEGSGNSTNTLSVVVGADKLSFLVNGVEVNSLPRSQIDSGGPNSGTTGVVGVRVNHNLDVHVDGLSITPGM